MDNLFIKPADIGSTLLDNYSAKRKYSVTKIILLAIMAGIFIGLGAVVSGIASHGIKDYGVGKFVTGAIFPLGLIAVVLTGSELFTGNTMLIAPLLNKRISASDLFRNLILVWVFNLVGSILLAFLIYNAGTMQANGNLYGANVIKVAVTKANLPLSQAFFSGILCNIMVCTAIYIAMAAKEVPGKILGIWFLIMGFVTAGFEHSVANMYYLFAGIFAKMNPALVARAGEAYQLDAGKISSLNIPNAFLNNLIPVTLGNIVGGMVFVGLLFYFAFGHHQKRQDLKNI